MDGTGVERISSGNGVHVVSFSPSMEYYLDSYSNSSTPPWLLLYRIKAKKISTVIPPAKSLFEKFSLVYLEFHAFKTEDGLELPAMMTRPADFSPEKKYPAIVYVYGGPGSQQVVDRWRS